MNSTCEHVWMPITDEEVEGKFKSTVTGEIVSYLPWKGNKPNGGDLENNVILSLDYQIYNDWYQNTIGTKYAFTCTSCNLPRNTEYIVFGVCKKSHFGESFFVLNLIKMK